MFVTISNLIVFVLLFIFLNYSGYSKLLIFTIMGFLIIINGPLTLKQKIAGLKLFIFIQSLALIFSLYYFIIKDKKPVIDAFLLGFIIYGVYDATSYAVFKKWSPGLAIVDTLWGGILFSLTTALTYQFS